MTPLYSKSKVKAAGEAAKLASSPSDLDPVAAQVINFWRQAHREPMLRAIDELSGLTAAGVQYAMAGRIKKLDTIIDKLKRPSSTGYLSTMHDIGGVRVVVRDMPSLRKVCSMVEALPSYCEEHSPKRDYIAHPKGDGYRGRHYILRYGGLGSGYDSLYVELQVRTERQHQWATAVEMYDSVKGTRLKFDGAACGGNAFFAWMSEVIRTLEEGPSADDRAQAPLAGAAAAAARDVLGCLDAARNGLSVIGGEPELKPGDYALIALNHEMQTIVVAACDEEEGLRRYFDSELAGGQEDTLLVKASSMELVKQMYPNYFGGIVSFSSLYGERLVPAADDLRPAP